ncbi:MAG: hypothetical protein COB27_004610 [Moritella sp.]|uniref:hypothetical protein n=1 Tax=Moritella sp. TaxID=78556 RepID=UPI00216DC2D8|nr:hypothetical protein [Moritella sp.]MBL1416142.1 hypothetical protein [Moritella sp.]
MAILRNTIAVLLLSTLSVPAMAKLSHETKTNITCAVLSGITHRDALADEYLDALPLDINQKSLSYQIGVTHGKLDMYGTLEGHDESTSAEHLYATICGFEQVTRGMD